MKKLCSLILALAMTFALVACGGGGSKEPAADPAPSIDAPAPSYEAPEEGAKYAETVYVGYRTGMDTTDPYGTTNATTAFYTNATHSVLIKSDYDTGELVGVLAESWEDASGGKGTAWRVKLREGVKFHDGTILNADDVVFTWNYAKDINNVVKVISNADGMVKEVVAEDEYTVLFDLNYCIPDFPAYLEIKMYSKEAFDTISDKEAAASVGTGPYMKGEYVSGVSFELVRFDDYYEGIEQFPTKNIIIKPYLDPNTLAAALQAGEIDYTFGASTSIYYTLNPDPNIETYSRTGAQSYYIGFNHKRDTWKNAEARQAVAMAVDKQALVDVNWEGIGATVNDNFCVPSGMGYSADTTTLPHDPEKARELFAKNGITEITIMVSTQKALAEVLQANLEAVGVKAIIDQVDDTAWVSLKGTHEYDVHIGDYGGYTGATLYNFNRFFSVGGSSNVNGVNEPEWEALMEETTKISTQEELFEIFGRMQDWAATSVPHVPIAINNMIAFGRKDVGGVKLAPTDNLMEVAYLYKVVE